MATSGRRAHARRRDDGGAAVLEMALVVSLLGLLLFGIIEFGYLMSFRGSMAQAASEGARRGAVAPDEASALLRAEESTEDAVSGFGQSCGSGGLTCNITIVDPCPNEVTARCVSVELVYDQAGYPLLPEIPLISAAIPDTLTTKAIAEINP